MDKATLSVSRPATMITLARLAFGLSTATLVLLAALHLLSPEFDPNWRMVSEYALGNFSWVLSLLFLAWGASSAMLFFAVRHHLTTLSGKVGLVLLLTSALGASMAAFFDITNPLHSLATLFGIPTFPVAALLITANLRQELAKGLSDQPLLWAAHLTWISLVVFIAVMIFGTAMSGGQFGPGAPIGWPNRLVVVADCAWTMAAAWQMNQISQQ